MPPPASPPRTTEIYPPSLSLSQVFPDTPSVRHALLRAIPSHQHQLPALNLAVCASIPCPVVPATSQSRRTEIFDRRFAAPTTHVHPSSLAPHPTLLYVAAHLVGRLSTFGSKHGILHLATPPHRHKLRVLVAPAPPPSLHDAPVYIRDWRHLPKTKAQPPVVEILLRDIHPLLPPPTSPTAPRLSSATLFPRGHLISICARIASRSPVLSAPSTPVFLLELVCPRHTHAIAVIFPSCALHWWPFVHPGRTVVITALRLSHIPRVSQRPVLAASKDTSVFLSDDISSTTAVSPRQCRRTSPYSGQVVEYEGDVTRLLPPDALELDGRVILHLADFTSCTAGRAPMRAFRTGTRLRATSVLALVRPDTAPALLATVRSSVDVLFFAALPATTPVHSPSPSGWRVLRRAARPPDLAWAGELAAVLSTKCSSWFGPDESGITAALLGTSDTVGLVQFLMFVLDSRIALLHPHKLPVRDAYAEFLHPVRYIPRDFAHPLVPTLARVRAVVSATNGMLTASKLAGRLCAGTTRGAARGVTVALVGLLLGLSDGSARVHLVDATDELDVVMPGGLQPSLLGAVVAIGDFRIVVTPRMDGPPCVAVVFAAKDVRVVVDGPCAAMERDEGGAPVARHFGETHRNEEFAASQGAVLRSISQNAHASSISQFSQGAVEGQIVDVPLVSVFVQRVERGIDEFRVCGRLVAWISSREAEAWNVVDCHGKEFWMCDVVINGAAALGMVATFREDTLFAISCTELNGIEDIAMYLQEKATRSFQRRKSLVLKLDLETMLPWIENIGQGIYMRFKVKDEELHKGVDLNGINGMNSDVSLEGEQYIYVSKAIEQFTKEGSRHAEDRLWRLYEKSNITDEDEKIVSLKGIVWNYEEQVMSHDRDGSVNRVGKLEVLDCKTMMFGVCIDFFEQDSRPIGMTRGMLIEVRELIRVPQQCDERFGFVGTRRTNIRVLKEDEGEGEGKVTDENEDENEEEEENEGEGDNNFREKSVEADTQVDCKCAMLKKYTAQSVVGQVERRFLSELEDGSEVGAVVHFDSMQVECIRIRRIQERRGCKECRVDYEHERKKWCSVDMEVIAEIDDGSQVAELRCRGWEACARLMGLNREERAAVKRVAACVGKAEMRHGGNETGLGLVDGVGRGIESELKRIWRTVSRRRCSARLAVVLVRDSGASTGGGGSDVVMRGFRMGFGRCLWTVCRAQGRRVRLQCMGSFAEAEAEDACGRAVGAVGAGQMVKNGW